MSWYDPNRLRRFADPLVLAVLLATQAARLDAQIDCSRAGNRSPATTVPQCVDANGIAASCSTGVSIRMWPDAFRPASEIPLSRDSTQRSGGQTVPGRKSGHERFKSVDVVTVGSSSPRLYVAYNSGFQVWNIATDPANPAILGSRDGWEKEFLSFPPVTETLNYIGDVSALNVDPTLDLVGVAGLRPVGPSFWEYRPSTRQLSQLYQDTATGARQVRLVKHGGSVYGIVGADNGLAVYNLTAARALSAPCLDAQGSKCRAAFPGFVGDTAGKTRNFIDALRIPAAAGRPERILVSAAGGFFTNLQLWELANPQAPGSAVERFRGFPNSLGSALFSTGGHYYVAVVSEDAGLDQEKLRILSIDGCVNGNTCSLADGSMVEAITPMTLAPNQATTWDFLFYSTGAGGTPYLYYGAGTANVAGPDLEQLFDLSALRPPFPRSLTEVTAGGGSYVDPCNRAAIRYWSHYYGNNTHGLNEMVPWGGKFSAAGYFYRAGLSILDVHVLGTPTGGGKIEIVSVDPGKQVYESCETVRLTAQLAGRGPAFWEWRHGGRALEGCSANFAGTGDLGGVVVACNAPAERFLGNPIFLDGFESGGLTAWSAAVPRSLAAPTLSVSVELRVWKTADKTQTPDDTERVTFTLAESGAPRFSDAARETVNGLSATLTHPATGAATWSWEIEDPAGTATCSFPGRGQVRCFKATTSAATQPAPETLTHTWPSAGTYKYRVTLAGCGTATAVRDDEVTVVGVQVRPDVLSFTLRGLQAACCGNVVSGFTCSRGVEVELAVRMKEDAGYSFSFDWERTSTVSTSFTAQAPSDRDAAKLEWYFKHAFSRTGSVFPIVRARTSGGTDDQSFIVVPVQVVSGSCR